MPEENKQKTARGYCRLATMVNRPTALSQVLLLENSQGVPLNIEGNRTRLSEAFIADGDPSMSPAMCGFLLQAFAMDKSSEASAKARIVANRLQASYDGMHLQYAMAAALRIRTEQPRLFAEMAEWHCPSCRGVCVELPQETIST